MKLVNSGIFLILLILSLGSVSGCYPDHRGVGVEIGIHDNRWHYDHDYDDNWRAQHRWHEDRKDWDR